MRDGRRTRVSTRFKHIGLYVYRRDFLLGYSDLPVGPLEQAERLEQLRALENGYPIRVVETEYESLGVDTPEDFERVSKLFEASLSIQWLNTSSLPAALSPPSEKASPRRASAVCSKAADCESRLQKFDPYLNVDPGTMSPFQHGEVFVTDDGAETDLDLGHYERFTHAHAHAEQQRHLRPDLRDDHRARAPRRLPGQDRPGDPARDQRNQSGDAARSRRMSTW